MCFGDKYSTLPPNNTSMVGKDWDGKYVVEGNSNVWLLGDRVKGWIDPETINIGRPGDTILDVKAQLTELFNWYEKLGQPYKKMYSQAGGNDYLRTMTLPDFFDFGKSMIKKRTEQLIIGYKTIFNKEDIVISSLPYVNPKKKMNSTTSWKESPYVALFSKEFKKAFGEMELNTYFAQGSFGIQEACQKYGVKYLDIWTILKGLWEEYGASYWWDEIHYAPPAQREICLKVKELWGI